MRNNLLAALGSKVVVGAAVTVLAFGTAGAVLALQPVSDSTPSESGRPFVAADETTTTTVAPTTTTVAPTTTTVAPTTTTTTVDDDATDDHDNFGAIVSKDAHDGGVDGQEISEAAHDRNDERKAEHDAEVNDDHGHDGSGHDVNDDHGGGQDD